MINLISPKEVETTIGVVAYLASLFAENDINIVELLSCWTDNIFIIKSSDIDKLINFLKF